MKMSSIASLITLYMNISRNKIYYDILKTRLKYKTDKLMMNQW